jgi:predicted secreted protein
MSWISAFAVYFIIWWITLFLVLPYGVRSQAESGDEMVPGTEPGAPVEAFLLRKLLANTVLAAIVFAAWIVATRYLGFSMDVLSGWIIGDN